MIWKADLKQAFPIRTFSASRFDRSGKPQGNSAVLMTEVLSRAIEKEEHGGASIAARIRFLRMSSLILNSTDREVISQ